MKIALIDDHKLFLQALKAQLEELPDVTLVDGFNHPDIFLRTANLNSFDYVFLDIHFKNSNGFDVLKQLKAQNFSGKIIMLSGNPSAYTLSQAIREGADGFIGKDAEKAELPAAIEATKTGDFYTGRTLSEYAHEILLQKKKHFLSEREIEIIQLIAQGLSYKEIGERLFISHRTVEAHRNNILEKLQLSNVTELIRFALKNHLV